MAASEALRGEERQAGVAINVQTSPAQTATRAITAESKIGQLVTLRSIVS